jgi:hypothetical protein
MSKIPSKMFDYADRREIEPIVSKLKWYRKGDKELGKNLDLEFAMFMYSPVQGYGWQDYQDHTADSVEKLKKLVVDNILKESPYGNSTCGQRGNWYDSNGAPAVAMLVGGYRGGVDAHLVFTSGKTAFGHATHKAAR